MRHRSSTPASSTPASCASSAPAPTARPGWPLAAGIIAGVAADALIGDPHRGHPVALFGRAAQALEDRLYADDALRGAGYTIACVALAAAPALAADRLGRGRPWLALAATAAATWAVTGARSLAGEAERIGRALADSDLEAARAALPSLCGRDPQQLDDKEITRAVIESVAENSGDAIVSPLVWGSAAGIGGLTIYRAVNTLDAMVGHRSPRLARFGSASARLDDVANWGPARLTALLTAACAPLVGGRPARTWRTARTYGPQHPSPNAGWCEAAFAGALGLCLGGSNSYGGVAEQRPELGDGRVPEPADIARAVRLCRAVTVAATLVSAAAALAGAALAGAALAGAALAGAALAGAALAGAGSPRRERPTR
jgi:adenosylcobinamide-phosphate synthase